MFIFLAQNILFKSKGMEEWWGILKSLPCESAKDHPAILILISQAAPLCTGDAEGQDLSPNCSFFCTLSSDLCWACSAPPDTAKPPLPHPSVSLQPGKGWRTTSIPISSWVSLSEVLLLLPLKPKWMWTYFFNLYIPTCCGSWRRGLVQSLWICREKSRVNVWLVVVQDLEQHIK